MLVEASAAACASLGYVECRSAFARLRREGGLTALQERRAVRDLDTRWDRLAAVDLDETVRKEAGDLTQRYPLRGSDAVHLASALAFADGAPRDLVFACWDGRLWRAAQAEGFQMVPTSEP